MTGLEKILRHIEDDAATAAQKEMAKAIRKADEILAAAKAEADKKYAEIMEQSRMDVKASLSRAESAASLQEKKLLLNAKQEIITEIIEKAEVSLARLPDEDYFDRIIRMVKKYALDQEGEIIFSPADKKRLPDQFESLLVAALADRTNAVLTVSGETRNMEGGFVLNYGEIEVNCSFEALFFAARENLQDKVREVLFQ